MLQSGTAGPMPMFRLTRCLPIQVHPTRWRPVMLLLVPLAIVLGSTPIALTAHTKRQTSASGLRVPGQATRAMVAAGNASAPHFSIQTIILGDGSRLERTIINGPPAPPPGYELERAPVASSALHQPGVANSLEVPAYNWVFGCSAVSASMIGAYFDRNGLSNIYTGPTNGGVMPMDNSVWPWWTDSAGASYPGNPLTASRLGSDGRNHQGLHRRLLGRLWQQRPGPLHHRRVGAAHLGRCIWRLHVDQPVRLRQHRRRNILLGLRGCLEVDVCSHGSRRLSRRHCRAQAFLRGARLYGD